MKQTKRYMGGYRKKMTALLLSAALLAGGAFTGCGTKNVDYEVDGGSGTDSGDIRSEYAIPASVNQEIDTGDSGLTKITIKDDDITVPSAATMYTRQCKRLDLSGTEKQELVESVFDGDAGIYEAETRIKSEIQEEIDGYTELQEDAVGKELQQYTEILESLNEELSNAPEERPEAGDYTSYSYVGSIGGREYKLTFPEEDGGSSAGYTQLNITEDWLSYRPADDSSVTYAEYFALDDYKYNNDFQGDETNQCTISEQKAEDMAEAFLSNLHATDMTLVDTSALCWLYYTDVNASEATESEVDGYEFTFRRSIGNQTVSDVEIQNADNIQEETGIYWMFPEELTVDIDGNGILSASWVVYLETDGEPEEAELLTYDEMLEKANESIPAYYRMYPTSYSEITFDNIELTYYIKQGDTEDAFEIIPAWVITQEETYEEEDYTNVLQVVILDAVTGETIDLKKLSTALGQYEETTPPAGDSTE